jgi:ubiquinone/menaquinone biosynthesis C-methylase UbiE
MDIQQSYDLWSGQYDSNNNKTRDLEAKAIRAVLQNINANNCLELGCGTGKNTAWLQTISRQITAVDISEGMLAQARQTISSKRVKFIQANLMDEWNFDIHNFDLVVFSLVPEHIENFENILGKAAGILSPGGYLYIGELHPLKQYMGTKARFETDEGTHILSCYTHHLSDYIIPALENNFELQKLFEFFDEDEPVDIPRILSLLFRKK